jgi:hypothetical protein
MRHRHYIPRKRRPAVEEPDPDAQHVYSRLRRDKVLDVVRLSLKARLKLSDMFVQTHPGRPISAMLMDLFPELEQITWSYSPDE